MKNAAADTGRIAKSAGMVSFAVMCSRVLGLVREQVFAVMFGAGTAYDAFVVAFRIPNLLRDLFGEGALSSAFVTVFTARRTTGRAEDAWRLANNVLSFFAVFVGALTLFGILASRSLVGLLAPDFALVADKVALTTRLTAIMFPFLVFISLASVVMGILNSWGRFFVPAMASSFFNLGSILGGVALALLLPRFGQPAIVGMAVGTLLGGILQLGWQLPSLYRCGFRLRLRIDLGDPDLRRIFRLMVPAIVGLSATQFNIFVNTYFASSCAEGSVSWLNYAFRLVQFPIGVFGVALSIAAQPVFAGYAARKDLAGMRSAFSSSMVMVFCLTIPATVGLLLLARPIVAVIFQHGAFTGFDTEQTAQALSYYSLGLFAYASVKVMVPVFYALDDTRYPVVASFMAVAVNVLIILAALDAMQHRVIALATSSSMAGSFLFLGVMLYRKMGGFPVRHLFSGAGKVAAASLVMGGGLLAAIRLFPAPAHLAMQIVRLLLLIAGAGGLYAVALHLLRLQEMQAIAGKLAARLRGRS
ncbi:MAG: murein biosynthesis integral membrane protein MurJ [Thermodesulfobacteriota bacterium]